MPTSGRVSITLPSELIESMDRLGRDRSRFIKEAVEHELARRRREGLRRSLGNPHPKTVELEGAGLSEWAASLPEGDESLVDPSAGRPVRWTPGEGWTEEAP